MQGAFSVKGAVLCIGDDNFGIEADKARRVAIRSEIAALSVRVNWAIGHFDGWVDDPSTGSDELSVLEDRLSGLSNTLDELGIPAANDC